MEVPPNGKAERYFNGSPLGVKRVSIHGSDLALSMFRHRSGKRVFFQLMLASKAAHSGPRGIKKMQSPPLCMPCMFCSKMGVVC
jgi:hypothetical protein